MSSVPYMSDSLKFAHCDIFCSSVVLPVSLFENFEVGAHETGTALHIGEFPESQMFHKPRGKCGVYTKHLRF